MERNQENVDLPTLITNGAHHSEAQADALAGQIEVTPAGANKTRRVIGSFIRSYRDKSPDLSS
ncbi:hypothetical protein M8369_42635, partial [Klebsiella pneumoniae]|nr:hypothetical protein [Klebsiella pneumoniae]